MAHKKLTKREFELVVRFERLSRDCDDAAEYEKKNDNRTCWVSRFEGMALAYIASSNMLRGLE